MIVVVDGNDGTGKSTVVERLGALGYDVRDRGVPTRMTDDRSAEPNDGEAYLILDAPVEVSRERLAKAGKDLSEQYHTVADLTHYRARYLEVAKRLPRCAVVDATGTPDEVVARCVDALRRLLYEVRIVEVKARPLAVVRGSATPATLATQIRAMFGEVYARLKSAPVRQSGQNVVLYRTGLAEIEVGVEVSAPFASGGGLVCSETPAGKAATVTHWGPYSLLPEAHAALRRRTASVNWEVYGDWSDDPVKLRTDVFYLVG